MTYFGTGQKTVICKNSHLQVTIRYSYRKTIILQGLRWPLNVICEEWELNANHHLARSVTCKVLMY